MARKSARVSLKKLAQRLERAVERSDWRQVEAVSERVRLLVESGACPEFRRQQFEGLFQKAAQRRRVLGQRAVLEAEDLSLEFIGRNSKAAGTSDSSARWLRSGIVARIWRWLSSTWKRRFTQADPEEIDSIGVRCLVTDEGIVFALVSVGSGGEGNVLYWNYAVDGWCFQGDQSLGRISIGRGDTLRLKSVKLRRWNVVYVEAAIDVFGAAQVCWHRLSFNGKDFIGRYELNLVDEAE